MVMSIEQLELRIMMVEENLESLRMVYNGCPTRLILEAIEETKEKLEELQYEHKRAKERERRKRSEGTSKIVEVVNKVK
jgi:hypothetical protein